MFRTTRRVIAEYIERKEREAMNSVEREFSMLRKSLMMWRQREMVGMFHQWADWTADRIALRVRLAERAERQRFVALAGREATRELRKAELNKWVPRTDPVSQNTYYEHVESKEVRWDRPARDFKTTHVRPERAPPSRRLT